MKKIVSILILVLVVSTVRAQETLGTWGSNYGGVAASFQNPAFIANSRLYKDINLVGGSASFYHNVEYLADTTSKGKNFLYNTLDLKRPDAQLKYYKDNRPPYDKGYLMSREMGPSYMLDRGNDAFSVTLSSRQFFSFNKIPDVIAKLIKNGYPDAQTILNGAYAFDQPMRAAGMTWSEIAGTYARRLPSTSKDLITLGITLKYLIGQGGAYAYVNNVSASASNITSIQVDRSSFQAGISMPYDYAASSNADWDKTISSGKGLGADLGFTFIHRRNINNELNSKQYCDQEFEDYDYRFSVALLDLGSIKFKHNARYISASNTTPVFYSFQNAANTTEEGINKVLSMYGIKGKDSLNTFRKFSILLPTALSLQYDIRIADRVYSTLAAIVAVPLGKNAIVRPSQIAIIPRYERDHFEVSLPVSLYEFSKPRVGLAARIYFLTLGTDRLFSIGQKTDYFGYDAYASIRINFMKIFRANFIKGECPESSKDACW